MKLEEAFAKARPRPREFIDRLPGYRDQILAVKHYRLWPDYQWERCQACSGVWFGHPAGYGNTLVVDGDTIPNGTGQFYDATSCPGLLP